MMHFTTTWLGLAQGLLYSVASASDPASGVGENVRVLSRGRPGHTIGPYHPGKSFLRSPPRNKTCVILNPGCCAEDQDDSANIMLAIEQCNDGGHVIFEPGTYMIGTPLDLTSLKHIDLEIQGTIKFTNDTTFWQANSFKHIFQNSSTFFQLGGTDVNVYGGGTFDGNGQAWYDLYAKEPYTLRPILFGTIGLHGASISDINLRYSPQWYNLVANSTDVVFSNISIAGKSTSKNVAANSDGWDTYRSSNIVIQNSRIDNGDDCVSFKPNSTDIVVQNLICRGSHGISVGSLGQYVGEVDVVKNIYVYNISMSDASDGARIKVWPGISSEMSPDLQGGGGSGSVQNITYDGMAISNVDYAIEITQCYGQRNLTLCNEYPSNLTISDVTIKNFKGVTSKKHDPVIGYLVCSSEKTCSRITLENIDVVSPSGTSLYKCGSIAGIEEQVNCTAGY